jgi:hypothetical protein
MVAGDFPGCGCCYSVERLEMEITIPRRNRRDVACAVVCAIYWCKVQFAEPSFGHQQVEQVIHDRPDMGVIINREPALRKALEAGFESELSGSQVYWDFGEPRNGRLAEHVTPSSINPTLVRVSKKQGRSGVDQCAGLLFELKNATFDKEFMSLYRAARERKISRDDFATSCIRLEFLAVQKTRAYFRSHPLSKPNTASSPFYTMVMRVTSDFSDYLRWLDTLDSDSDTYNIRHHYLLEYDRLIQP